MEEELFGRKKSKILIKSIVFLIIIAFAFMSVGYAEVTDVELGIKGKIEANNQEGVFITGITQLSAVNADTINSKMDSFIKTTVDTKIVLGNSLDSSITYQINLYNNSDKEYVFIDIMTAETEDNIYSSENIEIELNGIERCITTIGAKDKITYTVTFKYLENADLSNNTLMDKLNFRFQEIPRIVLDKEGQNDLISIEKSYGEAKQYLFTIFNYEILEDGQEKINNVPMTYNFETIIDENYFKVEIYDENGNIITENIVLEGDGETKVSETYTLKILWNTTDRNEEYEIEQFNCNVVLKANPDSEKYLQYVIAKEFNLQITAKYVPELSEEGVIEVGDAITAEDCGVSENEVEEYESMYGGNNGQIEYDNDGSIVLDEDNPILYEEITPGAQLSGNQYSLYFTIKSDFTAQETESTLISAGDGVKDYLTRVSFYKGYMYVYTYYSGSDKTGIEEETSSKGFWSYNISEYSNTIMNVQITGSRTGSTVVYINGQQITGNIKSGRSKIQTASVTIGDLRPLANQKFIGNLYDIEIYEKVLTAEEIQTNWEHAKKKWIE